MFMLFPPVLFNFALENIIRKVPQTESMTLSNVNVTCICGRHCDYRKDARGSYVMEIMKAGESIGLRGNMKKKQST